MNKDLALLGNLPVSSFQTYVDSVNKIPVLTAEEERDLAISLKENNDLQAAQRLVMSHLRFVVKIARGYNGYGLAVTDLVQEGNIGLMKAVRRFDPDRGVRLVSFAVHWIRAEIHEFVLRNWRIVKVATTKAQRKLFFNLRGKKKRLGWLNREEVESVAADLGVSPENVMEMESRLSGQDLGFDGAADSDDSSSATVSPAHYLPGPASNDPAIQLAENSQKAFDEKRLVAALAKLDDRSRDILQQRWLAEKKATLQDLSQVYKVSMERIRQIEANAMKKLRLSMAA